MAFPNSRGLPNRNNWLSRIEFVIACLAGEVTRAVDDSVGEDREVLRYVVRELNQDAGVYANI